MCLRNICVSYVIKNHLCFKHSAILILFVLNRKYLNEDKSKKYEKIRTEAIRTQIQASKSKGEISYITNGQNTKKTFGQPSGQLFPKRWPLSNRNRTKNNMNSHMVKRHRNSDTKSRQNSFLLGQAVSCSFNL